MLNNLLMEVHSIPASAEELKRRRKMENYNCDWCGRRIGTRKYYMHEDGAVTHRTECARWYCVAFGFECKI